MEKELRKALCQKCLKAIRKIEAKLLRVRRLKVKQAKVVSGKVPIKTK